MIHCFLNINQICIGPNVIPFSHTIMLFMFLSQLMNIPSSSSLSKLLISLWCPSWMKCALSCQIIILPSFAPVENDIFP